ncbi:MAG: hypothetical protein WCK89_14390 [bacterium]
MPHAPFTSRWTPVPAQVYELARTASPFTALVWISMLGDATRHETWQTTRKIEAVMAETGFAKNTVLKAYAELIEAGFITALSGGGGTRRTVTFALTPIANYAGKPPTPPDSKPSKPIGNW